MSMSPVYGEKLATVEINLGDGLRPRLVLCTRRSGAVIIYL